MGSGVILMIGFDVHHLPNISKLMIVGLFWLREMYFLYANLILYTYKVFKHGVEKQ